MQAPLLSVIDVCEAVPGTAASGSGVARTVGGND